MPQRTSLYHKYPDYRVDLEPTSARRLVRFGGEVVAESERTLTVRETQHDATIYFPRADVRMDLLQKTDHRTFCPFKGEASYWTVRAGDQVGENLVWGYEDPFDEVAALADYVSFYADRVELEEVASAGGGES